MENEPALLDVMLSDEQAQPPIYRPGPYWAGYQSRMVEAIGRHGIEDFRSDASVGKGYADSPTLRAEDGWHNQTGVRTSVKRAVLRLPFVCSLVEDYRALVQQYWSAANTFEAAYYRAYLGSWLSSTAVPALKDIDTLHGRGLTTTDIGNGVRVANQYISQLLQTENFTQRVGFGKVRTVIEIGGGFRSWLHLLLHHQPGVRKVAYIDIPPMIYVATQYMRHFFPDAVVDYRQTREENEIRVRDDDSLEILCLCLWQIDRLNISADLLWNSASFGEMPPEIVDNYAERTSSLLREPQSQACLILNKGKQTNGHKTCEPDRVLASFSARDFTCEMFTPPFIGEQVNVYAHCTRD